MQQSHCPTLGATNVMMPPGGPEAVGSMFSKKQLLFNKISFIGGVFLSETVADLRRALEQPQVSVFGW